MRGRGSKRRFAVRAFTVALTAMLGVLAVAPAQSVASNSSRYDELQQQIRETRARIRAAQRHERNLLAQIRESDARRSLYESKAASLADRLAIAVAHLDALQAQADEAAQELTLVSQQLEDALARLSDQRTQVDRHAAGLYIDSTETYTAVLLGTNDFRDFVAGVEYSNRLLSTDVQFLNQLNQTKEEVSEHRSAVEEKKAQLDKRQAELRAQAVEIGKLRQAELRAAQAAAAESGYRQQLLHGVRDQKQAYIRALQQMLAESDSIETILKGAQRGQTVVAGMGKGYLVWPTSGRITSSYGWRTHPIYGYRSFHTGIDIGAPSGQRVIAARRGEILYTGYKNAYGLIVIIDHGNSLATVYAHLSKVYVRPGQYVRTGSAIAAVGSTGWSTGPHLHFEVRVNGDHVNPVRYL